MLQNQAFKRRSTREWPHNAYGKHHRAKVSAAFVIEAAALSFAGAGNLPGLLRALRISDTAWLQFKLPESRSPPFRVLTCSPRGLFFCGTDAMRPPQPERWSMISGQTLRVCSEGKPVPTPLSKCGAGFFRIMRYGSRRLDRARLNHLRNMSSVSII